MAKMVCSVPAKTSDDPVTILLICVSARVTRGRCYDHNFLQFSHHFRRKNWRFLKNQCYDHFFSKIYLCFESNTPIFSPIFLAKIFKQ
jgi:hypothetical protein